MKPKHDTQDDIPRVVELVQSWLVDTYGLVTGLAATTNSNVRITTKIEGKEIKVTFDRLPLDDENGEPIESVSVSEPFSEMTFPYDWYGEQGYIFRNKLDWFDVDDDTSEKKEDRP